MTLLKDYLKTDDALEAAMLAVEHLRRGGLVLGKADVGYSFVASSGAALERSYELKGRPKTRRSVVLATPTTLNDLCHCPAPLAEKLFRVARESPLSAVLPVNERSVLLSTIDRAYWSFFTLNGTICLYFGVGDFFDHLGRLTACIGVPAIGSSANLSGTGNVYELRDVPGPLRSGSDLCLDLGSAKYKNAEKLAGTILGFEPGDERVHRRGVNAAFLEQTFREELRLANGIGNGAYDRFGTPQ